MTLLTLFKRRFEITLAEEYPPYVIACIKAPDIGRLILVFEQLSTKQLHTLSDRGRDYPIPIGFYHASEDGWARARAFTHAMRQQA